jgi:hypothetical protein
VSFPKRPKTLLNDPIIRRRPARDPHLFALGAVSVVSKETYFLRS